MVEWFRVKRVRDCRGLVGKIVKSIRVEELRGCPVVRWTFSPENGISDALQPAGEPSGRVEWNLEYAFSLKVDLDNLMKQYERANIH